MNEVVGHLQRKRGVLVSEIECLPTNSTCRFPSSKGFRETFLTSFKALFTIFKLSVAVLNTAADSVSKLPTLNWHLKGKVPKGGLLKSTLS